MFLPTVSVRYSHTKSIHMAVLWLLAKASIFYQEMHCFCLHYRLKYVFGLLTNDHCEYARWGEKVSVFPRQQCQKLESINGQELLLESTLWFKHKKVCPFDWNRGFSLCYSNIDRLLASNTRTGRAKLGVGTRGTQVSPTFEHFVK